MANMKKSLTFLWLFIACFYLSACGFHLRSHIEIPPQLKILALENANTHSLLTPLLKQNLQALGVRIITPPQTAPFTLVILNENLSQSKTALGTAQQVNTVVMNYTVAFTLKNRKQKTLSSPVILTASTSYLQNANQILGDSTMQASFQQELMRDMVNQILSHLSTSAIRHALSD